RYAWPGRELLGEFVFDIPSGDVESVTVSPSGQQAVVVSFEPPEWAYEVLALRPVLASLGVGHRGIIGYPGDPPPVSPDGRYLVTVAGPFGPLWWTPDNEVAHEDDAPPSEGGPHDLGALYVHDLEANAMQRHPLVVHLPAGWRPEEDRGGWSVIWGP